MLQLSRDADYMSKPSITDLDMNYQRALARGLQVQAHSQIVFESSGSIFKSHSAATGSVA